MVDHHSDSSPVTALSNNTLLFMKVLVQKTMSYWMLKDALLEWY